MKMLFVFVLLIGAWSDQSHSRGSDFPPKMQGIIKKSKLSLDHFGIAIGKPSGSEVLYELNSKKKLIPASISKLITAAAVLRAFPPGTKLKTTLQSNANIESGVLRGNLYLKGAGDPGFVSETMWFLVNHFTRSGISTIDGDIIVDSNIFDQNHFDESRQKERVDRAYDAPVSGMSFNWNSVNIFIRPSENVGGNAAVIVDPENDYVKLRAKVVTVKENSLKEGTSQISVERQESNDGDEIVVSGKIEKGSKEVVVYKSITQPEIWSGSNLRAFLKQRKIEVKGSVKIGTTPMDAKVLAEAESKPIENMVADMNKFSNNFVAEMLIKLVATRMNDNGTANSVNKINGNSGKKKASSSNSPGSITKSDGGTQRPGSIAVGVKSFENLFEELEVESADHHIINPSGLTRENKITARALLKVVSYLKNEFQVMPELMTSLPIAAVDGTLKKRFKNTHGERRIRAKTGYLNGVVALAGYVGTANGRVLPFVFMYNGGGDEGKVRSVMDQLALSLTSDPKAKFADKKILSDIEGQFKEDVEIPVLKE